MKLLQQVPYLRVDDVDRSIAFDRDALGFEVEDSFDEGGSTYWALLTQGDVRLMLSRGWVRILDPDGEHSHDEDEAEALTAARANDHGVTVDRGGHRYFNVVTYLYVESADDTHAHITAAGYRAVEEPSDKPHGVREFLVQDPDGYAYAIAQRLG